jgi:putative ATPase
MTTLFDDTLEKPLAERLRPQSLEDMVGQDHLVGPEGALRKSLDKGKIPSMILWGPPGCGKTTLARLFAKYVKADFVPLSAVFSGVADLRQVFEKAKNTRIQGRSTVLFVDEIHRFNRSQQDAFLPYVEDGTLTLIGATTENPSFELNAALISRCQVYVLKRLELEDLQKLVERAEQLLNHPLPLTPEAKQMLLEMADGDGRYLLNLIEHISTEDTTLDPESLQKLVQKRRPLYDKKQEAHYNLISALHKSLRGSDPDASLYWFMRMLEGGEDPLYIARRLIRFASEDIGLADPQALVQALSAIQAYERLGSPEGELALAQAVVYLATAPKSNAVYTAFKQSKKVASQTGSLMPPMHIVNAPTKLMDKLGYGEGYIYDHDTPEGFSGQNYFPESLPRPHFYRPFERGFERDLKKRLDYWAKLRDQKFPS